MSRSTDLHFDVASLLLVPKHTFFGLAWGYVGVPFCFIAFRICVPLRCFHKICGDDIFIILAWLIFLTTTILWGVNLTLDFIYVNYRAFWRCNTASLLRGGLIQMAAHLVCGIIFQPMRLVGQKMAWRPILAVTIAGWAIYVGVQYYPCTFASIEYVKVMAISVHLLWNARIKLQQQLAILALFSLTVIGMVDSIVRVEVALRGPREDDDTWFYICTTIKPTIAILVSCPFSHRALFTRDPQARPSRGIAAPNPSTREAYGAQSAIHTQRLALSEEMEEHVKTHPRPTGKKR